MTNLHNAQEDSSACDRQQEQSFENSGGPLCSDFVGRTLLSEISCDCVVLLVWRGHSCPRLFVWCGSDIPVRHSCLCGAGALACEVLICLGRKFLSGILACVARALLPASFCPCGSDIPARRIAHTQPRKRRPSLAQRFSAGLSQQLTSKSRRDGPQRAATRSGGLERAPRPRLFCPCGPDISCPTFLLVWRELVWRELVWRGFVWRGFVWRGHS